MKNSIAAFMILASLSFSAFSSAEDVVIPLIAKPAALQEGTQRELTASQVAELLPWAKNSKIFLNDLLNSIQGLSSADKLDRLEDGIKSLVSESAPKNSELLMRYVLNRGLVINDLLKAEMDADQVGTSDTKLRVLTSSINMAINYYETDISTLNKKTNAPFISFGIQYFNFLNELSKSIFDASASYNIQRTAFEWLQWDLYRDLNNQQAAPQIVKINNSLKIFSAKKMTDAKYIFNIRQLKLVADQLDLSSVEFNPVCEKATKSEVYASMCVGLAKKYKARNNFSEIVNTCADIMSSESYVSMCMDVALESQTDVRNMNTCKVFSSDSSRYSCIHKLRSIELAEVNFYVLEGCFKIMNDDTYKLTCVDNLFTQKNITWDDVLTCEKLDNKVSQYQCIKRAGVMKTE